MRISVLEKQFFAVCARTLSYCLIIFVLSAACAITIPDAARATSADVPYVKSGSGKIVLYTALTATTPQMPLWGAINAGRAKGHSLHVEYWKNLDDLRGVLLAGKGQIWVGHLEGFAQAAMRGAPVTLLAVTGWKKFYFLAPKESVADTIPALAEEVRKAGQPLAVAPQDSPAIGILEEIARNGPSFTVAAMPPQQLMLEMLRGTRQYALLPEPLVSILAAKNPGLRVAVSLEEEFGRLTGRQPFLPLVGVAVNTHFAREYPGLVRDLLTSMQEQAQKQAEDKPSAIAVLPDAVVEALGRTILAVSLSRDMIRVVPANTLKDEIGEFLAMVLHRRTGDNMGRRLADLLDGPFLLPRETAFSLSKTLQAGEE